MKYFIEALICPPGINVLLGLVGVGLCRYHRRMGLTLIVLSTFALYAASLPPVTLALINPLQAYPALSPASLASPRAQAIVVLGAGRNDDAPEYGADTLSNLALERLRYGVHLHRLTGLPLILVGGSPEGRGPAESELMRRAAEQDFNVPVLATEKRSRTTEENARDLVPLLRALHIHRVYLVTHAWHLPRATWAFRVAGIPYVEAPMGYFRPEDRSGMLESFLPGVRALYFTRLALHERLGLLWYRLKKNI